MKVPALGRIEPTQDGDSSSPVHSEVRWYGRNNNLRFRSDLVVVNPQNLVVREAEGLVMPTKGFGFNEYWAIIEIKLRRSDDCSDDSLKKYIRSDVSKLRRIRQEAETRLWDPLPVYYLLCLDKGRTDLSNWATEYRRSIDDFDRLEIAYRSSRR
jgi:hypothetical protein